MPCPAAANLDGKRKTGLAIAFSFFYLYITLPTILAAMFTGIKSWNEEFFSTTKKFAQAIEKIEIALVASWRT